jgi:hypothetical protein
LSRDAIARTLATLRTPALHQEPKLFQE